MEGKFPSKILVFMTVVTHNCDSFSCWSQIFYILPSICEDFILPSQIRFFERAFWVRQKFLVANRHFSCSDSLKILLFSFYSHTYTFCVCINNKLKHPHKTIILNVIHSTSSLCPWATQPKFTIKVSII